MKYLLTVMAVFFLSVSVSAGMTDKAKENKAAAEEKATEAKAHGKAKGKDKKEETEIEKATKKAEKDMKEKSKELEKSTDTSAVDKIFFDDGQGNVQELFI